MRNITGISLVELLVTLAVAALILGLSIPTFSAFLQSNRRAAAVNRLVSQLNHARYAALAQGEEIVVCASRDASSCSDALTWSSGWITFINADGDNPAVRDEGESLLRIAEPIGGDLRLDANRSRFKFHPLGRSGNGTWVICNGADASEGLAVILSTTGRVRLSHTLADGQPLNCAI